SRKVNARGGWIAAWASIRRQRDEFLLVTRHDVEPAGPPFLLRLLDALLGGRNKVPPDVASGTQGRAAEQHEMCAMRTGDNDLVARPEDQELVAGEAVAGDINLTGEQVD